MKILGIDPGFHRCGYGIIIDDGLKLKVVEYGLFTTPPEMIMAQRLADLMTDLNRLIRAQKPEAVAVEQVFFEKNRKTFSRVCQAQGVILAAAALAGQPTYEYTPLQVKQALTGYGRATQPQVQHMVRIILKIGQKIPVDDTADALAVAICHAHSSRRNPKYQIANLK